MAIIPKTKYPGQIDTTDVNYPQGKARNIVTAGDGTGTPWEKDLANDILGFQQALLNAAAITPSGTPDSATVSQYLQALTYIIKHTTFDAGARVQGSPLSLAQFPTLDAATVRRVQPLIPTGSLDGYRAQTNGATADANWYFNYNSFGWTQHKADPAGSFIVFPISNLVDQSTLQDVRVLLRGAAYTALPASGSMPTVTLYRTSDESTVPVQIGAVGLDTAGTLAIFKGAHEIIVPTSSLAIDSTATPRNFWVSIQGVGSAAFQVDALDVVRVTATFSVTKLTPG